MNSLRTSAVRGAALAVAAFFVLSGTYGRSQESAAAAVPSLAGETSAAVRELQDQVRQLRVLVDEMRAENVESRAEMHQLRQDLQATRSLLERPAGPAGSPSGAEANGVDAAENSSTASGPASSTSGAGLEERVQKLEDSTSLIGAKVDEQYQTKVETASKYRARLHGIVLMNAFRNVGGTDNLDFPNFAQPAGSATPLASIGATLRQSEIGLEIFGPTLVGG